MTENAIVVENLSKRYLIGHQLSAGKYTALRDVIGRGIRNFTRKARDVVCGRQVVQGDQVEEFWSLRDVSFEVKQGEVLGIIGRNGAGKSTLLKILSRITEPTEGRVSLRGRVASLLEVGTGFHPELTGRENIFLNGAILGMTQREIRKKFEEIVAFAEVEKFLDTPVKHYSSGMYVRLAFAVAAHLDPEILIVDEVLAVGDAEFQKKCLGKMSQVARESRTVLLVSHNMGAVRSLAQRCILLDRGRIIQVGASEDIIKTYFRQAIEAKNNIGHSEDLDFFRRGRADADPSAKITKIGLVGLSDTLSNEPVIRIGDKFAVKVQLAVNKGLDAADLTVTIRTSQGEAVATFTCADQALSLALEPGNPTIEFSISDLPLTPGDYFLDVGIDNMVGGSCCDFVFNYPLLSVVNDGQITHWLDRPWGVIQCRDITWNVSYN